MISCLDKHIVKNKKDYIFNIFSITLVESEDVAGIEINFLISSTRRLVQ